MRSILSDLKYAARMLGKQPVFTLVAVVTLSLGIGVNTTVFSGINAILLQPLPYSERVIVVNGVARQGEESDVSFADFNDFRARLTTVERSAAFRSTVLNLTGEGIPERLDACLVTEDFFTILGLRPLLGRTFGADDHRIGRTDVVVLGSGIWQRRFGGDPGVLGKTITLDGKTFTIVGVMPGTFQFPQTAKCWIPLVPNTAAATLDDRGTRSLRVLASLKPGIAPGAPQAELDALARQLGAAYPATNADIGVRITTLDEAVLKRFREKNRLAMAILQAAVFCVLLIACANLSNLLLAQAAKRHREFAVRMSLGAGRGRIVRQLVTESILLTILGGAGGIAFAAWTIRALTLGVEARLPRPIGIDAATLLFTLGVSVVTGFVFGLYPALAASKPDLVTSLKSVQASFDPHRGRFSRSLIVAEIALTMILLAAAGLMVRTFDNLTAVDPGFVPERTLAVGLTLPDSYAGKPERMRAFHAETARRVSAIQGVETVGAVGYPPLVGYNPGADVTFSDDGAFRVPTRVDYQPVTAGYFDAAGIPRRQGRALTETDLGESPSVALVNEALVRRYFPAGNAVGSRCTVRTPDGATERLEIVGIVGDVRQFGLDTPPRPELYVPKVQRRMTLLVKTTGDAGIATASVRDALADIDATVAPSFGTLETMLADSLQKRKVTANLLMFLSIAGLVLAIVGVYGVTAYATACRTREFGIRVALGARGQDLARLVLSQGMKPVALGVALGSVGTLGALRALRGLLYGVSPADPANLMGAILVLCAAAAVACWLPARNAARVDPMKALRSE